MAFSKAEQFEPKDIALARYAKALSHPARVAILRLLSKQDSCCCGDLVHDLPIAQATVSQHLKELKEVGLIKGEIDPPRVCYCLDRKNFKLAEKYLNSLFQ